MNLNTTLNCRRDLFKFQASASLFIDKQSKPKFTTNPISICKFLRILFTILSCLMLSTISICCSFWSHQSSTYNCGTIYFEVTCSSPLLLPTQIHQISPTLIREKFNIWSTNTCLQHYKKNSYIDIKHLVQKFQNIKFGNEQNKIDPITF